jgi:plasmid stability protein
MADKTMTISVPDVLYYRIQERADAEGRSMETEVVDLIAKGLPDERLPPELEAELAQLALLSDERLWKAARTRFSKKKAARLESLHFKMQRELISDAEMQEESALIRETERVMLVRAHAAVLLKERGYDIDVLLHE